MEIVSTAWIGDSVEEFELAGGLAPHARHGRASAAAPLRVFVLEGFERLPAHYRAHLAEAHIELVDAEALARHWRARLPGIVQRLNHYEASCCLRWPVLRDALAGAPFLHIDLDIFLQPDLATVAAALQGRTFTLGSPCFLAVAARDWLDTWCEQIEAFDRDPEGCQARLGYSGNAVRAHSGSDQDLLAALVGAGVLPRGEIGPLGRTHAAFVNPLHPRFPGRRTPMHAQRRDGIDLFDERPVLFWHMQNDFARYAGRHMMLARHRGRAEVPRVAAQLAGMPPSAEDVAFDLLRSFVLRPLRGEIATGRLDLDRMLHLAARGPLECLLRGVTTRQFVLQGEGRELFTARHWWQPDVFA